MWCVDGLFGGFYYAHLMTLKIVKKNIFFFTIWLAEVYAKDVLYSKLSSMLFKFSQKYPEYYVLCPVINC
jgi:hypothetical protein